MKKNQLKIQPLRIDIDLASFACCEVHLFSFLVVCRLQGIEKSTSQTSAETEMVIQQEVSLAVCPKNITPGLKQVLGCQIILCSAPFQYPDDDLVCS